MKNFLANVKNKKGFTLVEIIVVLAILAILIAVAVPSMTGAINDAKDKTSLSDARAAYIAYELKATVGDPTLADIKEYLGKTDGAIQVAVTRTGENVTTFCYTDKNLKRGASGRAKYVEITMSGDNNEAKIVTGAFPETDALS